jgi:phage baseplate assembly protein W
MATIYLDNLINPRQTNSSATTVSKETPSTGPIYTDLHLDLVIAKNAGVGLNAHDSDDIEIDEDTAAIKNSLYNIFSTIPGQKLLTPSFGASLDQYVFESVDTMRGKIIGEDILRAITTFEPRIQVLNIEVYPKPDELMYYIILVYQLVGLNKVYRNQIQVESNNIKVI